MNDINNKDNSGIILTSSTWFSLKAINNESQLHSKAKIVNITPIGIIIYNNENRFHNENSINICIAANKIGE